MKILLAFIIIVYNFAYSMDVNNNGDYELINESYKNFSTNYKPSPQWPNKPCAFINHLQEQFLKTTSQLEAEHIQKLLELSAKDEFYFKYKKQSVTEIQKIFITGMYERSKVLINFPILGSYKDLSNIYAKAIKEHLNNFDRYNPTFYSWQNVKDSNFFNDNFWIRLSKLASKADKSISNHIKEITKLPLYQRDIMPQFALNEAVGLFYKYRLQTLY